MSKGFEDHFLKQATREHVQANMAAYARHRKAKPYMNKFARGLAVSMLRMRNGSLGLWKRTSVIGNLAILGGALFFLNPWVLGGGTAAFLAVTGYQHLPAAIRNPIGNTLRPVGKFLGRLGHAIWRGVTKVTGAAAKWIINPTIAGGRPILGRRLGKLWSVSLGSLFYLSFAPIVAGLAGLGKALHAHVAAAPNMSAIEAAEYQKWHPIITGSFIAMQMLLVPFAMEGKKAMQQSDFWRSSFHTYNVMIDRQLRTEALNTKTVPQARTMFGRAVAAFKPAEFIWNHTMDLIEMMEPRYRIADDRRVAAIKKRKSLKLAIRAAYRKASAEKKQIARAIKKGLASPYPRVTV